MQIPGILRPTRKKVFILIAAVIVIFALFNFFDPKKQTQLQFADVKKQDIESTVSASGTLTGKNSANLRFKSSGKLGFINIKTGDSVFTGQIIAGLDTQDLSINLQQAENTLRDKQATVDKILDDIHLFQYGNGGFGNVATANETMTQRQARTTAEVARDNALDNVKAAQRAFQDTVVISPINGIITQAIEVPGQTVSGADLIAQVVDASEPFFDTDIDEADLSKVAVGQFAAVTLNSYPDKTFRGTVNQILPTTKTTSQGATVITVKILMDNQGFRFVNGLTGQASIITGHAGKVLTIPLEALRDDNTVLVQDNDGLRVQKVTPGISSDTDVEIKEGLKEGDKVLLNPPAPGNRIPTVNRNRNPLGGILRFAGGGRSR